MQKGLTQEQVEDLEKTIRGREVEQLYIDRIGKELSEYNIGYYNGIKDATRDILDKLIKLKTAPKRYVDLEEVNSLLSIYANSFSKYTLGDCLEDAKSKAKTLEELNEENGK